LKVTNPAGVNFDGDYGSTNVILGTSAETNVPLGLIKTLTLDPIDPWATTNLVGGFLGLDTDRSKNLVSIMASGSSFSLEAF